MDNSKPLVTILIPVFNEENCIIGCLTSILNNDYPHGKLQIIILDGMSGDKTRELIGNFIQQYPFITLMDNPGRIQTSALNLGIKNAQGEIIIRMDAHTIYDSQYISICVSKLLSTPAWNVGGTQFAVGTNYITRSISYCMTSAFGMGNAYFRYKQKEMWVDTVYLGAWKKETLEKLGGFNENWKINEDYELNYRIRLNGGKILLSPDIKSKYYVRNSIAKLIKQYFKYGFWRAKTILTYPKSVKIRYLIPPVFIIALLFTLPIEFRAHSLFFVLAGFYIFINLAFSVLISLKKGFQYFFSLPWIFLIIHLTWGMGFLVGLMRFSLQRIQTFLV